MDADRRTFIQQAAAVGLTVATPAWRRALAVEISQAEVRGHVVSAGKPLGGVRVSDGYRVVATDAAGEFRLTVGKHSGAFVFVTNPRGYWSDRFYVPTSTAIAKPPIFRLSPAIQPSTENADHDYRALYITDIHLGDGHREESFKRFAATVDEINKLDPLPAFCWMGGDISLQRGEGRKYVELCNRLKMPVRNGVGNHEMLIKAANPRSEFQQLFGPTYYSFDVGNVHYITLDGCQLEPSQQGYKNVIGQLSPRELHWLAEDLKQVPQETATVVAIHIPLVSDYPQRRGTTAAKAPHWVIQNADEVIELLAGHGVPLVLQGHLHENQRMTRKGIEFVESVSVCGTWWKSPEKIREDCVSGEPRGYRILDIHGDRIEHHYQSSAESHVDDLGEIVGHPRTLPRGQDAELQVNVFDASEQATVSARIDNEPPVVLPRSSDSKHFANLEPTHHWKWKISADQLNAGRHVLHVQLKEPAKPVHSFEHVLEV